MEKGKDFQWTSCEHPVNILSRTLLSIILFSCRKLSFGAPVSSASCSVSKHFAVRTVHICLLLKRHLLFGIVYTADVESPKRVVLLNTTLVWIGNLSQSAEGDEPSWQFYPQHNLFSKPFHLCLMTKFSHHGYMLSLPWPFVILPSHTLCAVIMSAFLPSLPVWCTFSCSTWPFQQEEKTLVEQNRLYLINLLSALLS